MGVSIIQQAIIATNDFDGTAPSGAATRIRDIARFPVEAAGGLFDFEVKDPAQISSIQLHLGGQTSWTIHKRDSDGDEILMWSGTTEGSFYTLAEDSMEIYEEELVVVRTTGASTAMKCRIACSR